MSEQPIGRIAYRRWKWNKRWERRKKIGYPPTNNTPLEFDGVNDSINIYNSYLSDIKIFDHALTAEEILAIYNPTKPWYKRLWRWIARIFRRRTLREKILCMKPLAFWPLDEMSGEVAKDISGNGNDATFEELMSDKGSEWGVIFKVGGKANE